MYITYALLDIVQYAAIHSLIVCINLLHYVLAYILFKRKENFTKYLQKYI